MENFSYVFSLSADRDNDSDGKMRVNIKYDDASGIGVNLNREFDEDTYQQGINDMLEDLETQLTNAVAAKSLRDAVQEEQADDTDELFRAIDRLQDKIDRLERKIKSLETCDYDEPKECEEPPIHDPRDVQSPFSPFGKVWC